LSAFGGRVATTEALLAHRFAHMPATTKRLWQLTARQSAGDDVTRELEELVKHGGPGVQRIASARLAKGMAPVRASAEASATLDRVDRDVASVPAVTSKKTPATTALTVVNLYAFAREVPGGSTDTANLYRMGALVASKEFRVGDAWRLATAACLHLGALHVALNVVALILLGRQLEARIGSWRTVAVYVASALGGNLAYVAYVALSGHEATLVVGASGAIMGIVGALAFVAWRRFRRDGTRLARRQVVAIVSVPALQALFDAMTPQVSMAVHLFGLGIGAFAALVVGQPADPVKVLPRHVSVVRSMAGVALGVVSCVVGLEWAWAAEGPRSVCAEGRERECREECEGGKAQACDWLAYREWRVDAPREQLADAASLWARGCDLGSAVGCNDLGLMVAAGIGVPRDPARAVALFKRSCDGGDEHGCAELGRALLHGSGVARDDAAGRRFLSSACEHGDETACRDVKSLDTKSSDGL
jgi:membrane associated rhomboid family serine protease